MRRPTRPNVIQVYRILLLSLPLDDDDDDDDGGGGGGGGDDHSNIVLRSVHSPFSIGAQLDLFFSWVKDGSTEPGSRLETQHGLALWGEQRTPAPHRLVRCSSILPSFHTPLRTHARLAACLHRVEACRSAVTAGS